MVVGSESQPASGDTEGSNGTTPPAGGASEPKGTEGEKSFAVSAEDWQSAQGQIEDLKKQLNGVIRSKKDAETQAKTATTEKLTLEQQVAELSGKFEAEVTKRADLEKQGRVAAVADEILDKAKVPAGNRKLAKLALQDLGLDLASEDRDAVIADALKKLPESYPQLVKQAETARPNVPNHPLVSNGTAVVQKLGIKSDSGDALL